MMNKYYLNILLFFLMVIPLRSQQESSFNHYMFNSQLFNPAFVGLEENVTISSLNNIQWVGFDGNPSTNSLLFDASLDNNLGLGVQLLSDIIGPLNSNYLAVDLSYHLALNDKSQKLSVGLKLSVNDHNINLNKLKYDNLSDPTAQIKNSYFITNIGFGLYYYTDSLYFGFSIPYFFEPNKINKQRHYYLSGGYTKSLGNKFQINPNFLIKKTKGSPTSINFSSILFYNEAFWLGANFGSSDKNFTSPKITGGDISFMTGFKISSSLTLGYSYTSPIGEWTSSYNSNSHEIFIKIKTINSLKKSSEESDTEEIPKEKN